MKKAFLIVLAFTAMRIPFYAQNTAHVAERLRSLINTKQSAWNETVNYSSINKTNMKKSIFMATLITASMTVNAQSINKDEQAVRSLITTLETRWNNKNAETFSSSFADVHDYIVVNGMYFSNFTRQGNAAAHQQLFDGVYKNYNIKLKIDKVNFLRSDLALVTAIGAGYEKGNSLPENPGIIMTVLAEKKNDSWKIISFHNHELSDNLQERSPMPLNVMYASWYK